MASLESKSIIGPGIGYGINIAKFFYGSSLCIDILNDPHLISEKIFKTMQDVDKIIGKKVLAEIEKLQKNQNVLKMSYPDGDYHGMTIIIGIHKDNASFFIDYPAESEELVKNAKDGRVSFEFSSEDGMQYSFRTSVRKVEKERIRIRFPEAIERIQRRRHYRVSAPLGTRMLLNATDKKFELHVINLSEGGALLNQKARFHDDDMFQEGKYLEGLCLVHEEGDQKTRIGIRQACIIRAEKKQETDRYHYAVEFVDVGRLEADHIRQFIYWCQREVLKRRRHHWGAVPAGTKIILDTSGKRFEFNVVNLRDGGALLNQKAELHDDGLLQEGRHLKDLHLVYYDEGNRKIRIEIRQVYIMKIEKNRDARSCRYAVKFVDMDKVEADRIREFIYDWQRRSA